MYGGGTQVCALAWGAVFLVGPKSCFHAGDFVALCVWQCHLRNVTPDCSIRPSFKGGLLRLGRDFAPSPREGVAKGRQEGRLV